MAMRAPPIFVPIVAVVGILGATLAIADDPEPARPAGDITLHEPMPGPNPGQRSPLIGDEPRAGKNPIAFPAGDKLLPEPELEPTTNQEPVFGDKSAATDRQTEDTPDRNTGPDSTLHYVAVFNPDVVPFKRLSALDTVREDYTMGLARTALTELPVGGQTNRSRDRFWGSIQIRLAPGNDVAIPSVAPDMRILSYEIEPTRQLTFSKDGADNFYVRTDDPGASGIHRLVFLVDADAGYFAPSLPTSQHYTPKIVRDLAPAEIKPMLPASIAAAGRAQLDRMGIDERDELGIAFNKLVRFFRAFEAKQLPPSSGDVYKDLCDAQAGVCRHRSFAFLVTSLALGIPARYVTNEAHAFVEVWLPERNWQRIDLGGAALRMEVSNADDKTLHRPRADDPFARPPEYENNYTELSGDIRGLSQQQLKDKRKPLSDAPPSGDFVDPGAPPSDDEDIDVGAVGPDPSLPPRKIDPKKKTPKITITYSNDTGYRGEALRVEGRVDVDNAPLPDRAVDIFIAPAGRGGSGQILIGRGTTGADGTFSVDVDLPGSLDLQTYELFVTSRDDAKYNAAISDL
jgi:transglutaminase-like putative cysteine protease